MPYELSYKGFRLFKNTEGGWYAYDELMRKSITYTTITELHHAIDNGNVDIVISKFYNISSYDLINISE